MDIVAFIGLCMLLTILWASGIIPMFIVACILLFLWEKFHNIIITILFLAGLMLVLKYIFQIFGYKFFQNGKDNKTYKTANEKELEENLKKVREWSKRNNC